MRAVIFKNSVYQLLARILQILTTLTVTIAITRYYGAQTFGDFSVVMAYVTTFYVIGEYGFSVSIVKEISDDLNLLKNKISNYIFTKLVVSVLVSSIAYLMLSFMPYETHIKNAIIFSLPVLVVNSLNNLSITIYQLKKAYKYLFLSTLVSSLLYLISVWYIVRFISFGTNALVYIILTFVVSTIIGMLIGFGFLREYLSFISYKSVGLKESFNFLVFTFPFGAYLVVNTLMINIDRLIMSYFLSTVTVGFYSLAYRIFEVVILLPTFIMNSSYPILLSLNKSKDDKHRFYKLFSHILHISFASSIIIAVISILVFNYVITSVWGVSMQISYNYLVILLVFTSIFYITAPLSYVLIIANKQKTLLKIYTNGFIFNVILCLIFIPLYGAYAAALITGVTEALILLLIIYFIIKDPNMKLSEFFNIKYLLKRY